MISRRRFLGLGASATLGAAAGLGGVAGPAFARTEGRRLGGIPSVSTASSVSNAPSDAGPKVVIVRLGGGVRRLETLVPGPTNHAPYLLHDLVPRGTLWDDVRLEGHPTHSTGTMNLISGVYGWFESLLPKDQLVPKGPTIFECARRDLGLPMHQALYVNNCESTELVGWSDADGYGDAYRPGLLSVPELVRHELAHARERYDREGRDPEPLDRTERKLDSDWYRPRLAMSDAEIRRFWERERVYQWRGQHRGTDETVYELARAALADLKPKLMIVNFQDVDYAHWGVPYVYFRALRKSDRYTRDLFEQIQQDPYYRDDTYFLVTTDCGRDSRPNAWVAYQHHELDQPTSHEIFHLAIGPHVEAGKRVDRRRHQIDLAPTVGELLGFRAAHWEGEPLAELLG